MRESERERERRERGKEKEREVGLRGTSFQEVKKKKREQERERERESTGREKSSNLCSTLSFRFTRRFVKQLKPKGVVGLENCIICAFLCKWK